MQFILVRHAEAVPIGTGDVRKDSERFLSARGTADAQRLGRFLKTLGFANVPILTSPLVRAEQTAKILAETVGQATGYITTKYLKLDELNGRELCRLVKESCFQQVIMVGHNPDISRFASDLIGGGDLHLSTASAVCVEFDEKIKVGKGRLSWAIPPTIPTALFPDTLTEKCENSHEVS